MANENKFTGRAENYAAARPGYPEELICFLYTECGLSVSSCIADIGSGTGKLTGQLLMQGNTVYGVEPNEEMRRKAEKNLSSYPSFHSVDGNAAHTGLPADYFDAVVAAQAFHWFDPEAFRRECKRILKPSGNVFLIWNLRDITETVNQAWTELFKYHANNFHGFNNGLVKDDPRICRFFSSGYHYREFPNPLRFDRETFRKRIFSSSYAPTPEDTNYNDFAGEVERIFDTYCDGEILTVPHYTAIYWNSIQ